MEWNTDMDAAPRGSYVEMPEPRGRHHAIVKKFQHERILLSIIDAGEPKTIPSYRTEPNRWSPQGRWAGCSDNQTILGWMHLPAPLDEEQP